MSMTPEHLADLRTAKHILEHPAIAAKLTNLIGMPIEKGIKLLPETWTQHINDVTTKSLKIALDAVLLTVTEHGQAPSDNLWHKIAATATGAVGGAF